MRQSRKYNDHSFKDRIIGNVVLGVIIIAIIGIYKLLKYLFQF